VANVVKLPTRVKKIYS